MSTASGDLRYSLSGQGDPVVLLDWTPWKSPALAGALAAAYRVLSVEPPENDVRVKAIDDVAAAVLAVADWAGLGPFTLVGTSLGADAALRVALQRPLSVPTLVVISPTCVAPSRPTRRNTPELAASAMLAHPDDAHDLPEPRRTALLASLAEGRGASGGDATSLLPALSSATLAVFGQEDRLVPREAGGIWKGSVPNCSVCYVYDAGHAVGVDRPDALAAVVLDFVERRETFVVENRSSLINP